MRLSWGQKLGGLVLLGGALVVGAPQPAYALDATGCFTPVGGIDGVNPDYKTICSTYKPCTNGVNDARWNGAFGYGWETGSLGEAELKAISGTDPDVPGQRMIFLSWKHLITTNAIKANEGIQLGFAYLPTGTTDYVTQGVSQIIVVTFGRAGDPDITTASPINADGTITAQQPGSVKLLQKIGSNDAVTWQTSSPTGANWVKQHTAMFILQDTAGGPLYWVVQMGIPITTPATAPDPTQNWDTQAVYLDGNQFLTPSLGIHFWADEITSPLDTGAVIYRPWPDPGLNPEKNLPLIQNQNRDGSDEHVPSPDHWTSMQPGVPNPTSGAPTCAGKGLTFINSNIHDNSASADWTLDLYTKTSATSAAQAPNDISVDVTNNSSVDYAASDIKAKFSIAPYGSQTARSASWAPLDDNGNAIVCTQGSGANCVGPHPAGGNPLQSAVAWGDAKANHQFNLHTATPWKPSASYTCAVVDDGGTPYDQRSELASFCAGQPWTPQGQNAVGLPEHQCMQVELSSSGASGGVQFANKSAFRNMHASHASLHKENAIIDTSGLPKHKDKGHFIYLYVETRNMPHDIPSGNPPEIGSRRNGKGRAAECEECDYSYDDLATYMPTFVVHAFADTGYRTKFGKKKLVILEPMTSYGNFVTHDGKNYGWDAMLEYADKIGNNTYRLWVPNDGTAVVTTHIEALDNPRCQGNVTGDVHKLLASLEEVVEQSSAYWASQLDPFTKACGGDKSAAQCDDLYRVLRDIGLVDWGCWSSWVKSLITQIETNSGCKCAR